MKLPYTLRDYINYEIYTVSLIEALTYKTRESEAKLVNK
jgi:hypothetical protein